MLRTRVFLAVSWVLAVASAAPQEMPGNVAQVVFIKPKAGMRQQLEQGAKRHMDWHRQHKDTWTWAVWEVIAGDRTGDYVAATLNHHWKDFDDHAQFMQADVADANTNIMPYVESEAARFYLMHPEMSRPPDTPGFSTFSEALEFRVKAGAEPEFLLVMGKVHEAIQKTDWPVRYIWYSLYIGGDHPTYVLLLPRNNWTEFKPVEPPFLAMLEKAFGRLEADSLMKMLTKSVESQRSEIIMFRPDLSYIPAGQ